MVLVEQAVDSSVAPVQARMMRGWGSGPSLDVVFYAFGNCSIGSSSVSG